MGWQDGPARWVDHQIEQHPALERWLELHFHAIGLHGPAVRHLLKTRVMPAAILVLATMLLLIATLVVRRLRRSRARRGTRPSTRTDSSPRSGTTKPSGAPR